MKRVINEVVEEMRASGYDVKLISGDKWNSSSATTEERKPCIVLDPLRFKSIEDGAAKEYTFDIGFLIHLNQDERNTTIMNDYYEHCLLLYDTFMYKLRRYRNEDDQQFIKVLDDNAVEYPDYINQEYPMTGILSTVRANLNTNTQCY